MIDYINRKIFDLSQVYHTLKSSIKNDYLNQFLLRMK